MVLIGLRQETRAGDQTVDRVVVRIVPIRVFQMRHRHALPEQVLLHAANAAVGRTRCGRRRAVQLAAAPELYGGLGSGQQLVVRGMLSRVEAVVAAGANGGAVVQVAADAGALGQPAARAAAVRAAPLDAAALAAGRVRGGGGGAGAGNQVRAGFAHLANELAAKTNPEKKDFKVTQIPNIRKNRFSRNPVNINYL